MAVHTHSDCTIGKQTPVFCKYAIVGIKRFMDVNHIDDLQSQGDEGSSLQISHRQVGMGVMIVSGSISSLMVSTLTLEWKDVCVQILL